jgi:two-component system OmpR family response regulator
VSYSIPPYMAYLSTLVIDANSEAAEMLSNQLKHGGFVVDTAHSCPAALLAVRAQYYGTMVFVGDVGHPPDLKCIAELRRRAPHTWIVMISASAQPDTRDLFLRNGVDSLLVTPFSMQDLASRLQGFSQRSRPP